jgi:predicted ATPase
VRGREFGYELIAPVAQRPEKELQAALDHASYLFKHALVQDAAYGTLLRRPRQLLHGASPTSCWRQNRPPRGER